MSYQRNNNLESNFHAPLGRLRAPPPRTRPDGKKHFKKKMFYFSRPILAFFLLGLRISFVFGFTEGFPRFSLGEKPRHGVAPSRKRLDRSGGERLPILILLYSSYYIRLFRGKYDLLSYSIAQPDISLFFSLDVAIRSASRIHIFIYQ